MAFLGMRTLEDRRVRGDLIETFKILTGQNDVKYQTWFKLAKDQEGSVETRAKTGYLNLVQPIQAKTEVRRNFFSQRVVPIWNKLPNHIKQVKKTNEFKNAYDEHTGFKK